VWRIAQIDSRLTAPATAQMIILVDCEIRTRPSRYSLYRSQLEPVRGTVSVSSVELDVCVFLPIPVGRTTSTKVLVEDQYIKVVVYVIVERPVGFAAYGDTGIREVIVFGTTAFAPLSVPVL